MAEQQGTIEVTQLPATFLQDLQNMQATLQQVVQENAQLRQELANQRAATAAVAQQTAQGVAGASPSDPSMVTDPVAQAILTAVREMTDVVKHQRGVSSSGSPQLVDVKGIGKPPIFSGEETKFQAWSTRMKNFITAVFPDLAPVLEWAVEQENVITQQMMSDAYGEDADLTDQVLDLQNKLHQMKMLMVQMTENEPFDIVRNSGESFMAGIEAWRKLH